MCWRHDSARCTLGQKWMGTRFRDWCTTCVQWDNPTGHNHVTLETRQGSRSLEGSDGPSSACLWDCFRTGMRGPLLLCYPHWHTSVSLRGVQEKLVGAMSTQLRDQNWECRGPIVIQVTVQIADTFPFGGNKGDRAIRLVGAHSALSWRYTVQGWDICLRLEP